MLGVFLEASRHIWAALGDMAICWVHALKSGIKTEPLLRYPLLEILPLAHLGGIHIFESERLIRVRFGENACGVAILQSQRYLYFCCRGEMEEAANCDHNSPRLSVNDGGGRAYMERWS